MMTRILKAGRHSFSLDEAAHIHRMIGAGEQPVCPVCWRPLYVLKGSIGKRELLLCRCESCDHIVTIQFDGVNGIR